MSKNESFHIKYTVEFKGISNSGHQPRVIESIMMAVIQTIASRWVTLETLTVITDLKTKEIKKYSGTLRA